MKFKEIMKKNNNIIIFINIVIIIIYQLILLKSFLTKVRNLQFNVYDYLIFIFSDFYFIFLILFLIVIIAFYKVIYENYSNKYMIIRFSSKNKFIIYNLICIMIIDCMIVGTVVIMSIIQLLGKVSLVNKWSEYGIYRFNNTEVIAYTPLDITVKSILLVYIYIFALGCFMIIFKLYLKNPILSIIGIVVLNFINTSIFLVKLKELYFISLIHNTLYIFLYNKKIYIFWSILFFIFIILIRYKTKKCDF